MPEHEIIKRLRVGEAPTAVELLATLDELAGSDSLAARFSDIVKGILDAWDNSLASIVVAFLCAGLQKHKGNEAAASQAAAGIKRCLHPTVNTGFVASLLEKHQAAAVSISAALSHPEHRPLHELVLLFGDAANTDIERQELVEANFFEAALQFANIAGPSGTKVRARDITSPPLRVTSVSRFPPHFPCCSLWLCAWRTCLETLRRGMWPTYWGSANGPSSPCCALRTPRTSRRRVSCPVQIKLYAGFRPHHTLVLAIRFPVPVTPAGKPITTP